MPAPHLTGQWSGRATRQAFYSVRGAVACGPPLTAGVKLPMALVNRLICGAL
jgi:hypothetical protein